jgi:hypothetical protein
MNLRDLISSSQPSQFQSSSDEPHFQNYLLTQISDNEIADPYHQVLDPTQNESEDDLLVAHTEVLRHEKLVHRNLWKR